ncbi:MAG: MFS transporter [Kiritimatiellae bacterium]|nr:MFS transporter [Kiritimatiellia bacterium]MDW8458647.1 MFS transporter [Verrucomicrobiota bacterium]
MKVFIEEARGSEQSAPVPLPLSRPDFLALRRRSLRASIVEGAFTMVFMTWTSGSVLTGYLLALGATPLEIAAAASMPFLIQVFGPLVTWWAARVRNRILYIQTMTAFGRGMWAVAVFLPWMDFSRPAQVLIGLIAISGLLQVGTGPAWVSLMGDTVLSEERGRYFGLRNGIMSVVSTAAALSAGYYLDRARSPDGFQFIMAIALIFAVVGIVLYAQQVDPPRSVTLKSFSESVREPLRNKVFLRFVLFSMYWNAAVMVSSPFVFPYFLGPLRMSFTQVAMWSAIVAIVTLIAAPLWGRVADQVGHKTVLKITSLIVGIVLPLCWILSAPDFLPFIWLSAVVDGVGWGGFNTAAFNMSLVTAPARARMMYLAVLGAATGATGFFAALLSGLLFESLGRLTYTIGSFEWTAFHNLFLLAIFLRGSAWFLLKQVPDSPGRSLMQLLREYTQRGMSLVLQSRTGAA